MKRYSSILAIVVIIISTLFYAEKANAQYSDRISLQTFYDELSPYGYWFNDPDYGYVWSPNAERNFRPYYTNGHWSMTQYGNTWVSNYEWGWAAFHYGRWTYDNYYGWLWIPGYEWAPAWVSWRSGGGYYGWAPLGPGSYNNYGYDDDYYVPNFWWIFIPNNTIYSQNYYSYWRGPRFNDRYLYRSRVMHNHYNNYYACGPNRAEIEHFSGRNITVYNLRNERNMGRPRMGTNEIGMYRPEVNNFPRNDVNRRSEMPKNIRPLSQPIQKTEVASMNKDVRSERNMNSDRNNLKDNNINRIIEDRAPIDRPVFQNGNSNKIEPIRESSNNFGDKNNRFDNGVYFQRDVQQPIPDRNVDINQNQLRYNEQAIKNTPQPQNNRPQIEWRRPEPQRLEQPQQQVSPKMTDLNVERRENSSPERQIQDTRQNNPPIQLNNNRNQQAGFRR